jgi:alpha-tubulin suppressor-like RCC1 family protein
MLGEKIDHIFMASLLCWLLVACPEPKPTNTAREVRVTPAIATIATNGSVELQAVVIGAENTGVVWTVADNAKLTDITANRAVFQAPGFLSNTTQFKVSAQSVVNPNIKTEVTIEVVPSVTGVSLESDKAKLVPNERAQVSVFVSGTDSSLVTWTIVGGSGRLSATTGASIEFIAPLVTTETSTTLEAKSTLDPSKMALLTLETRPLRSKIATGVYHSMALHPELGLRTWGTNETGVLGDGTQLDRLSPTLLALPEMPMAVATGAAHALALGKNHLYVWGSSQDGALGLGDTTQVLTPTQLALENVSQIAAGANHSLALTRDGRLLTFGENSAGQLGLGDTINKPRPTQVSLAGVVSIAAAGAHSAAINQNGEVFVWGNQASQNFAQDQTTPRKLENLTGVIAVALGLQHGLALTEQGEVWSWGVNRYLATGHPGNATLQSPKKLEGFGRVVAIAAGNNHSLVLEQDGKVYAFGNNQNGQLGGPTDQPFQATPRLVTDHTSGIAAGNNHNFAVIEGALFGWGSNAFGQLGLGKKSYSETPKMVLPRVAQP